MVGRGFRLHPSKTNCLVLDFGGNVLRHGPVDQIKIKQRDLGLGTAPVKECPECLSVIAAGYTRCPDCGYEFPPPERSKHEAKATEAGILSGQVTTEKHTVQDVFYSVHIKRGAGRDAPKSMRVDYKIGWHRYQSEWVCFEHDGYARQKAIAWWKKRSRASVPATAREAVDIANNGGLALTTSITVRSVTGEEFPRIIDCELGPLPDEPNDNDSRNEACPQCGCELRSWARGQGPHAAKEVCTECNRFLRWVPKDEVASYSTAFPFGECAVAAEEEIPF
jgi:DNA repair protein RadD